MGSTMLEGIRRAGGVVNLAVAGVANATAIYTRPTFAQMIGNKTMKIRKLRVRNNAGGNCWLAVGTGVGGAFANLMPPVFVTNNIDTPWQEVEIPGVEAAATITAFPDVLVAAGSLDVQIEVEEMG